jgi:flagellar hook-basal body complex protein FliE
MTIKELGATALMPAVAQAPKTAGAGAVKAEFGSYLKDALGEANQLQQVADKAIQQLVAEGKGDLQDTMVAMEKADISFRFMMQVRNKVLEAYQEIIRMQV